MKVTVCGLGRMGTAFAAALVTASHEVTCWRTVSSADWSPPNASG
ncbi:NAD(P)-binding domain-containing protein [Kitasatospora sp. P5_F3]